MTTFGKGVTIFFKSVSVSVLIFCIFPSSSFALTSPSSSAPIPKVGASDVISIFSDAYRDLAGTNFNPNWGQATAVSVVTIDGGNVLRYSGLNYQGINIGSDVGTEQDVSGYESVHVDFWTADSTEIKFFLISPGPQETFYSLPVETGKWVSVNIPLTEYSSVVDLTRVFQFKVEGDGTVFLDNLYFQNSVSNGQNNSVDCGDCTESLSGVIYHWGSHKFISSVELTVTSPAEGSAQTIIQDASSDTAGRYAFSEPLNGSNRLQISKDVLEENESAVVTSLDALAALKIAVGINPNNDPDLEGPQGRLSVSPYQFIAADVNRDGRVTSSDALEILKMAVGLENAISASWVFVNENYDFVNRSTTGQTSGFSTSRSNVNWDIENIILENVDQSEINLVGVLLGDVTGDWESPGNSDTLDESYFVNLSERLNSPMSQWGLSSLAPVITSFSFLKEHNPNINEDITMDISSNLIAGRVADNIPTTDLIATIIHDGVELTKNGIQQISGKTSNDFTSIVEYQVVDVDGQSNVYQVDLTRFTGLPIIYLTTEGMVPIDSKENYVDGYASVDGGRMAPDLSATDIEIRGRGHSTWYVHPKKPYQMKFEDKVNFLGMPKDRKWIFLAEYSDKTMLRNKMAFELGYLSDLEWTPNSMFAEVYLNGQYQGTYHISQKVEESSNRVNIGDDGYLIEIDTPDHLTPEDVVFQAENFLMSIKEPEISETSVEYAYIRDFFREFESALFGPEFVSESAGYSKYIDMTSFVDWYLISEITKNVDSRNYSSMYLHLVPSGKITMGPLWDFDLSFGNVDYADSRYTDGYWIKEHAWYQRLFQDPSFVRLVKERFMFFKGNQNFLLNKIDEYAEQLRWAQEENDSRWATIGSYVWPNPVVFDTYTEEVNHLKAWLSARMDWLGQALNDLSLVEVVIEDGESISVVSVPGIIQAEEYTDMLGIQSESTGDVNGGENVGYISEGDWLEYEIDAAEMGEYLVEYRIASAREGGSFEMMIDDEALDQQIVPLTDGWQNWITISTTLNLTAGRHRVRINARSDGWNLNWIRFTLQ